MVVRMSCASNVARGIPRALALGVLATVGFVAGRAEGALQEEGLPIVPATRTEEKTALELLKQRSPRLPVDGEASVVINGRARRQYLPPSWTAADFKDDPTMSLDPTFKIRIFWIVSRANDCHYCLGHQEVKLSAAGDTEDEIARLDCDWEAFDPASRAAFAYARAATLDPASVDQAMIDELRKHYDARQIVEIAHVVAMFNSVNRWTDALGLPQDDRMRDHDVRFDTPTSPQYADVRSLVAPLDRGPVDAPPDSDETERGLAEALRRRSLLDDPGVPGAAADGPAWVRAWSCFPEVGAAAIAARRDQLEGTEFDHELAAVIARTTAKRNRAWYAFGTAERRLSELGWSADRRRLLDDPNAIERADLAAVVRFATRLTRRPERIGDDDIAALRLHFDDVTVARIVFVAGASNQFDRFTETLRLRLEEPIDSTEADRADSAAELTDEAKQALERLADLPDDSEAGLMRDAILSGSRLGPGEGWFGVAVTRSRYDWPAVVAAWDADANGRLQRNELALDDTDFARIDRNRDGEITEDDLNPEPREPGDGLREMVRRLDADGDGRLTAGEFDTLRDRLIGAAMENAPKRSVLAGNAGWMTVDELRGTLLPPATGRSGPNDMPTASTLIVALDRQEIGAHDPGPSLGDLAPDFDEPTLGGGRFVLSDGLAERPTVVVLGNFTCGPFRSQAGNLHRLFERYSDRFRFVMIYVREAHPTGGWSMERNRHQGVEIEQPADDAERRAVAERCAAHLGFEIPVIVDGIDDRLGKAFSGMPARLYLIDRQGKVAFKSGRGPFGFDVSALESAMVFELLNGNGSTTEE
ncbi:MAG TPA: hypothetical protein DCQ98_20475 [Planctomycetaceae bacterium]|nr:hypothetical protein [Planctomycetaceae bacterium]HRE98964.1 deiodinase family protein [Pirellulaceae bacterium]